MPSYSKLFLKPFIGGLNTEGSDTDDLTLNTSDELNCTILPEGKRGRRYGFNIEQDGKWIETNEPINTHTVYYWENVYADHSYIVVQINTKLFIYENIQPISQREPIYTYTIPVNEPNLINEPVSIAGVSNLLFVVGKWMLPIVIKYDADLGRFIEPEINNLKYRDINGIDDGFQVDELPATMTARHLYNLKNQGWEKDIYDAEAKKTYALLPTTNYNGKFFEDYKETYGAGRYPANNMQWFLGKEKSGEYNTTDLLNKYFGNTPAPKGHFILDYISRSRQKVSNIDIDEEENQDTTNFHFEIPCYSNASFFNYPMMQARMHSNATDFISNYKDYMSKQDENAAAYFNLPANISGELSKLKVVINDPTEIGSALTPFEADRYVYENARYKGRGDGLRSEFYAMARPFNIEVLGIDSDGTRHTIYSQPANFSTTAIVGTAQEYDIVIANPSKYRRYSVAIKWNGTLSNTPEGYSLLPYKIVADIDIIELNKTEGGSNIVEGLPVSDLLTGAISKVEAFGGRIFYLIGNTVLFSQTLKQGLQNYDKCYQDADPTSEEISDIIATDGGMIQLLTIGKGRTLKAFNRGVIAFGDKEIVGILSPLENLFTAAEYDIIKISNIGITGEYSAVSTDDSIYFWGHHGIYQIVMNENNIICQCITNQSIHNYFMNIETFSKNNAIGSYDMANNRIIWMYPTNENNPHRLDRGLVLDLNYNCFMPIAVDSGNVVRDSNGEYVGVYNEKTQKVNNEVVHFEGNIVYNNKNELVGYTQNKYLTDLTSTKNVVKIKPSMVIRADGDRVKAGTNNVVVNTETSVEYNRNSAVVYLAIDGTKYSFADFNDREFRDWDVSPYESYMVSKPISLGDTFYNKQTPIMQTIFQRTEENKLGDYNYTVPEDRENYTLTPWFTYTYFNRNMEQSYKTYMFVNVSPLIGNPSKFLSGSVDIDLNSLPKKLLDMNYSYKARIELRGFMNGGVYYDPELYDVVASNEQISKDKRLTMLLNATEQATKKYDRYELYTTLDFYSYQIPTQEYIQYPYQWSAEGSVAHILMSDVDISKGVFDSTKKEIVTKDVYEIFIKGTGNSDGVKGKKVNAVEGYLAMYNLKSRPSQSPAQWSMHGDIRMPRYDDKYIIDEYEVTNDSPRIFYPPITHGTVPTLYGEKFLMYTDKICIYNESDFQSAVFEGTVSTWVPVLQERKQPKLNIAKYVTESGAYIRMRWGWSLNDKSNRWDMMQNGYRPQKDFLYDEYVESRLHICGRGKAFQIEIRNDSNKDFRILGLNIITRSK